MKQKTKKADRAELVRRIYSILDGHYGDLNWWPGETPFEVVVGAILTQNTSWHNVTQAIRNLKEAGMLCPEIMIEAQTGEIAGLIRPSGYFNIKARRLKNFLMFLFSEFGGKLEKMFDTETTMLRSKLLGVNGIGEETADSILLYAGGKPVFVVDAYTKRVLARHGLVREGAGYGETREVITGSTPGDTRLYNQFHALFVHVGKDFCRKQPLCGSCPLRALSHD